MLSILNSKVWTVTHQELSHSLLPPVVHKQRTGFTWLFYLLKSTPTATHCWSPETINTPCILEIPGIRSVVRRTCIEQFGPVKRALYADAATERAPLTSPSVMPPWPLMQRQVLYLGVLHRTTRPGLSSMSQKGTNSRCKIYSIRFLSPIIQTIFFCVATWPNNS